MSNIPDSNRQFRGTSVNFGDGGAGAIAEGVNRIGHALSKGARIMEESRLLDLRNRQMATLGNFEKEMAALSLDMASDESLTDLTPDALRDHVYRGFTDLKNRLAEKLPGNGEDEIAALKRDMDKTVDAGTVAFMQAHNQQLKARTTQQLGKLIQDMQGKVRSGDLSPEDAVAEIDRNIDLFGGAIGEVNIATTKRQAGRAMLAARQDHHIANRDFTNARSHMFYQSEDGEIQPTELAQAFYEPEELESYQSVLDQEENRAFDHQRRQGMAAFRSAINAAESEESLALIRGQLDQALENNQLLESQYVLVMGQLDQKQAKVTTDHASLDRVLGLFDGTQPPLDPNDSGHQRGVEIYYKARIGQLQEGEEFEDLALEVVRDTGMVPQSMASTIRAYLNAGDEEEITTAVRLIGGLDDMGRLDQSGFSRDEIALATIANGYIDASVSEEKAIQRAQEMLSPVNREVREAREQELEELDIDYTREAVAAISYPHSTGHRFVLSRQSDFEGPFENFPELRKGSNQLDQRLGEKIGVILPRKPRQEVPGSGGATERITADYKRLFKYWFLRTGRDLEAVKTAGRELREKWSFSLASGLGRIMAYAPEKTYGVIDQGPQDAKWIRDQLIQHWVGSDNWQDGPKLDTDNVYLTFVPGTEEEPRYHVHVIQEDDSVSMVMNRERPGEPWIWKPDWRASPYYHAYKEKQAQQLQAAREKLRGGTGR